MVIFLSSWRLLWVYCPLATRPGRSDRLRHDNSELIFGGSFSILVSRIRISVQAKSLFKNRKIIQKCITKNCGGCLPLAVSQVYGYRFLKVCSLLVWPFGKKSPPSIAVKGFRSSNSLTEILFKPANKFSTTHTSLYLETWGCHMKQGTQIGSSSDTANKKFVCIVD